MGTFSDDERCRLIRESVSHLPNVEAAAFAGLVVRFCREHGASILLRGLRAVGDFEPEFRMGMANRDLAPEIETMFLLTRPEMQFVSSSLVREIASHGGDFERYVTPPVAAALRERLAVDRAQGSGREAAQDLDEDSEQGSES
jgi:pantetheine-phosphate adenylyltransferase